MKGSKYVKYFYNYKSFNYKPILSSDIAMGCRFLQLPESSYNFRWCLSCNMTDWEWLIIEKQFLEIDFLDKKDWFSIQSMQICTVSAKILSIINLLWDLLNNLPI